jgi:hypothetical protein
MEKDMKKILGILCLSVFLNGCATVISGSDREVSIKSYPAGASYVIEDKHGKVVQTGKTPETVRLDTGTGYFSGAEYTVKAEKKSYVQKTTTIGSEINPWYFGNLLLGGVFGMLIVDPITGAMWSIPDHHEFVLQTK